MEASISTPEGYFWSQVRYNLPSSKYNVSKKSLLTFFNASLRSVGSQFQIKKFEMTNADFGDKVITFEDGVYQDGEEVMLYYTLPWFGYKLHIGSSTSYKTKNISSIVLNSMLLMAMNGLDIFGYLIADSYDDNLFGYEPTRLIRLTKHLLSTCCFFYSQHFRYGKDNLKIEEFTYRCACCFYYMLVSGGSVEESIRNLNQSLIEQNKVNFRLKFGQKEDKPVRVTVGNADKGTRHSFSMTKYGDDITKQIYNLYPEHSTREITKILNDKGVAISKSSVDRKIQIIKDYERMQKEIAEVTNGR